MKRVIKNRVQLANFYDEMLEGLQILEKVDKSLIGEFKEFKPPRTPAQNRKVHAMLDEMGAFTGDPDVKTFIKGMAFWPTVYMEHFGEAKIVPKSASKLTKAEASEIVDWLKVVAAEHLPGFEWSHNE